MAASLLLVSGVGCSLFPDIRRKAEYNNPFPQITRVAILPFFNQSDEPTLSGERVALAYYNEMQLIPGFEVMPVGSVQAALQQFGREPQTGSDFQEFAQFLGVDAVLVGAVTDYTPYYPPRMTLRVNWYAANPSFHPVPAGYGLPWGTSKEKEIPAWVELESERALAKAQLETQTPQMVARNVGAGAEQEPAEVMTASALMALQEEAMEDAAASEAVSSIDKLPPGNDPPPSPKEVLQAETPDLAEMETPLPTVWPDPTGFIPDPPRQEPPPARPQTEPIFSHMRAYNGNDEHFTEQLENYYYFKTDARSNDWTSYLKRSEDFIRFCCHLHLTETLVARGGQTESRLILRWPIDRYQR